MSTDYTMTEMVESLKKRGLIPVNQKTFEPSDLIRFMSEELMNFVVPRIMEVRENYFVEHYDQALVADQARYNIHTRAIGMKIKRLFWLDENGHVRGTLYQTNIDEIPYLNFDDSSPFPQFFYFIDNFIS